MPFKDVRVRRDDFVYPDTRMLVVLSRFEGTSAIGLRVNSNHHS
jgi:hypothetical protein